MRRLIFTLFVLVLIIWPARNSNGQQSNASASASKEASGRVTSLGPVRRVVTGKNAEGKSAVIFDGPAPTTFQNGTQQLIWLTDSTPADNSGNRDATQGLAQSSLFPNSTGAVFKLSEFPAGFRDYAVPSMSEQATTEHATKTIAYVVIMSGEIDLRMEDGSDVHLKAGDVLVRRGGVHRWINRGKQPCRIAVIQMNAKEIQP